MDPKDLQRIEREWEGHADSYTLGKTAKGPIDLVNATLPGNANVHHDLAEGAFQIMALLEDVEQFIPPFRAIFSPHDNPNLHTNFELKAKALRHAASGTCKYSLSLPHIFVNPDAYIDLDITSPLSVKLTGWTSACTPTSPARLFPITWDAPSLPPATKRKTFIHNHPLTMDPCQHPSLLLLHGQFLSHGSGPTAHPTLIPQFSYCPTLLHHDIMAAMPINWLQDIYPRSEDPEWDEKGDDRLQWRGSNTGIWHDSDSEPWGERWREAQRTRLVRWANNWGSGENVTVLVGVGSDDEGEQRGGRVGDGLEMMKGRIAPAMLDVVFAKEPLNCAPDTCEELKNEFEFRRPQSVKMAGNYKYILDVSGDLRFLSGKEWDIDCA